MTRAASISSHSPTVGSWTIETGIPGDGSIDAFRDLTRRIVRDFQSVFAILTQIQSARADLTWFDTDGRVIRVEESVPVSLDESGEINLPAGDVLPTAVFADGALAKGIDPAPDATANVSAFSLIYSCVLEEKNGQDTPVDSAVTITTTADVWIGPVNAGNRRHLTMALMKWERLRSKPITEWYSGIYRDKVTRYGFTSS